MLIKSQAGQVILIAVLGIGIIVSGIVYFAASRQSATSTLTHNLAHEQAAFEALGEAAKIVQSIYANEAGCDPGTLNTRLSAITNLPATASSLSLSYGSGSLNYANVTSSLAQMSSKGNVCATTGTGCRQLAIPVDGFLYVVTVGLVSADTDSYTTARGTRDCPRDASVSLSVALSSGVVHGASTASVFTQRVTLSNICTFDACDGTNAVTSGGNGPALDFEAPFSGGATITVTAGKTTAACTGADNFIVSRSYGAGFTEAGSTTLSIDDLKWARRYLETGGEDVGDTTFLYMNGLTAVPGTASYANGACSVATSGLSGGSPQCGDKPCFPAFDLNRDGKNNEEDLTILEHFIRGYLTTLPVNDGLL